MVKGFAQHFFAFGIKLQQRRRLAFPNQEKRLVLVARIGSKHGVCEHHDRRLVHVVPPRQLLTESGFSMKAKNKR